ncbi:hypothetical protein IT418_02195 [bacterium]|nr:hypothetical protein [bacterium]
MNFMHSMESPNNAVRVLEYVQKKKSGVGAYIQGLISLGVFLVTILVVIFVYVPNIRSTQELSKKRQTVQQEVDELQKKYTVISMYNVSELEEGLKTARVYIPDDIRVAQLATFINVNSKQFNLEVSRLGINEDKTEVKQTAGDEEKDKLLGNNSAANKVFLGRVEGPFGFRGSREDIYKFLDFLVTGGFATNFDQVTINAGDGEKNWAVSFFTSYYYLQPVVKVEADRPLLEIQKDALKPIRFDETVSVPTVSATPTPTATTTPSVSP